MALENPNSYAAKKFNQIKYSSTADKMWSSIIEFANRALEPFDFEKARTIFESKNSFDISNFGNEKLLYSSMSAALIGLSTSLSMCFTRRLCRYFAAMPTHILTVK